MGPLFPVGRPPRAGAAQASQGAYLILCGHREETEAREGRGPARGGENPHAWSPHLRELRSCCPDPVAPRTTPMRLCHGAS